MDLCLDNSTAVCYINRDGGTKSAVLTALSRSFLSWCESRDISVYAFHLPGINNSIADAESGRSPDANDWMLCPRLFHQIALLWPIQVDLFASAWNAQVTRFVSWTPQPDAEATDAFTLRWTHLDGYAFPPFPLIPRCLMKIRREQAQVVLVCPFWPNQPYFPLLLETAVDVPRVLPGFPVCSYHLKTLCTL